MPAVVPASQMYQPVRCTASQLYSQPVRVVEDRMSIKTRATVASSKGRIKPQAVVKTSRSKVRGQAARSRRQAVTKVEDKPQEGEDKP